jgi:PAS domain-containing protein
MEFNTPQKANGGHHAPLPPRFDALYGETLKMVFESLADRGPPGTAGRGYRLELLDLALRAAGMGVWQWEAEQGRRWGSPRAHALLGTVEWDDGVSPLPLEAAHSSDRAELQTWLDACFSQLEHGEEIDVRVVTSDATIRWLAISAIAEVDALDHPRRITGTMLDITHRKSVEDQLVHQALHDPLTNLPNRTLLHDRLQQMMLSCNRGESVSRVWVWVTARRSERHSHSMRLDSGS